MKLFLTLAAAAALAACATDKNDQNHEMKSVDSMALENRVADTVSLDMTGMT